MRFGIRELIFVLLLLAIPCTYYFMVVQPRTEKHESARAEVVKVESKIKSVSKATAAIEDVEAEIQKLQGAIAHFKSMLPSDREVETLLRGVWDLAGEHGLTARSVRPDKIVPAAQYAELPIKMEISGDFDGFYNFMKDIEKLPRITRMPRIKIVKQDREAGGVVKADLTLSIFFEGNKVASAG